MNGLDPTPESYAHARAIAAMLERAHQEEHPELEDGRPPSEQDMTEPTA